MRALRFLALSTISIASLGAIAYGVSRYLQSPARQKSKRSAMRAASKGKRKLNSSLPRSANGHQRASA